MRIAIDVNGVLRDTITKIQQVYEKWYIENPHLPESGYTYDIISPITSLDISQHLKFQNEDEVYDFLYTEHCMEIFGHAPSVAMSTFIDLDEFYKTNRDKHDIMIISDEIGRSKPSTLFFLSKFGCQVERVVFYSKITIDKIWNEFDVLLTANPDLLLNHPQDKKVIKFEAVYNQNIDFKNNIDTLKSLNEKILELE
jgi:acetone carboxylase gamma subunit